MAELGHSLDKNTYNEQVPILRTQLLTIQQTLKECDFPVIILISGVDGVVKAKSLIYSMSGWTRVTCERWLFRIPVMKSKNVLNSGVFGDFTA